MAYTLVEQWLSPPKDAILRQVLMITTKLVAGIIRSEFVLTHKRTQLHQSNNLEMRSELLQLHLSLWTGTQSNSSAKHHQKLRLPKNKQNNHSSKSTVMRSQWKGLTPLTMASSKQKKDQKLAPSFLLNLNQTKISSKEVSELRDILSPKAMNSIENKGFNINII